MLPEELIYVGVVHPLDQLVGQLPPDELQDLHHREDTFAVVGQLKKYRN